MKKDMFKWLSIFVMAVVCVGFASCGDDDEDNGVIDNSGDTGVGIISKALTGSWTGKPVGQSGMLVCKFGENGSLDMAVSGARGNATEWHGTYTFTGSSEGGIITAKWNDGTEESIQVAYITANTMTLVKNYISYQMKRGEPDDDSAEDNEGDNNDGEESAHNYAPSNVSGKHFRIIYSSTTYDLYFTSNSTINPASGTSDGHAIINNATYEKISADKAKISITTSYTYSFYLTFTSESAGTVEHGSLQYSFTMDDYTMLNFSAPESVAYLTFTDVSLSRWLRFGSQSGSRVYVNSFKWGSVSHYSDNFAVTYNKTSSKQATLVIEHTYKNLSSSTSSNTDTWTYNLTFTTGEGGNYSRSGTSTNRYMNLAGMDGTGTFTLK